MTTAYGAAYRRRRRMMLSDSPGCVWCGAPATTADHWPPLASADGDGWEGVLLPACARCNSGHRAARAVRGGRARDAPPPRRRVIRRR